MRTRKLASSTCLLGCWVALALSAPASGQERFGDTTDVVVVEVPVQVLRNGEPVRGLTKDDFEILEGRKKQEIIGFDVIDLTLSQTLPGEAIAAFVPASGRRHFLLFFDLSFSNPASILRARQAATDLVLNSMHPSDLVGVATYAASQGVRFPLGFTSDRKQVELAIQTLGLWQMVETVRDPLGIMFADRDALRESEGFGEGDAGGGLAGVPDAEAEIRALLEDIDRDLMAATNRNQILALSSAMTSLAEALANVEGRKHVLYLSEGFDSTVVVGSGRGSTFEEQRRIQQVNEAAAAGRVWEVSSDERFGNTSTQNQLTSMLQEFVRADATIEAIDIGGLRDTANTKNEDGLFMMAAETGGQFVSNFNDLTEALGEVMERTSVTYLLAFEPKKVRYDGKFKPIKVRLKDAPRGTRIVHRPGYFDPKPLSELSGIERRFSTADLILAGREGGSVATSVIAGAFPHSGDKAHVPVLIEIDGRSLIGGTRGDVLPTEIFAYAIDANGEVQDFFTQALGLDLRKVRPALEQSGFKFWGNLELPPGEYSVRVLVRNGESGDSGLRVARVSVPVPGSDQALLLPPFLPEPGGKWLLGREQNADPTQFSYPFMLGEKAFIPAAKPVIAGSETATVSLIGYNLGGGSLAARAELFTLDGNPVEGAEIQLQDRLEGRDGMEQLVANLDCSGVAAGEYRLIVTIKNLASGATQSSSIQVEIAG